MILWLCRIWLLASRGELNHNPTVFYPMVFALAGRVNLVVGVAVAIGQLAV